MAKDSTHYGVTGAWTTLQIRFVEAYFQAGFSKTKAAALAGSKAKNLGQAGHELSTTEHVKKAIEKERSKRLGPLESEIHFELLELLRIQAIADRSGIYRDNFQVKPLNQWTEEQKLLLESVSYQTNADGDTIPTPKLISKERSQQILAKAIGMLRERLEISGDNLAAEVRSVKDKVTATGDRVRERLTIALKTVAEKRKQEDGKWKKI